MHGGVWTCDRTLLSNIHRLYITIPTYPVYVADGVGREVIIDDNVHSLEVHPPTHQVSADQNPDLGREGEGEGSGGEGRGGEGEGRGGGGKGREGEGEGSGGEGKGRGGEWTQGRERGTFS